jgi:hypothetical protein
MDLAQLQQAILANQQAENSIVGLQEDQARADKMRGMFTPRGGAAPNLLDVAGTVLAGHKARDIEGRTTPALVKARAKQAEAKSTMEGAVLQRAMQREQRDAEMQTDKLRDTQGNRATYVSADGTKEATVYEDRDGNLLFQGSNEPVPADWLAKERAYGAGGGGSLKHYNSNDQAKLIDIMNVARKQNRLDVTFKPEYAQPTGLPTGFINRIAGALSQNDILAYADESMDANVKEAAMWWADFKMNYELIKRHDMFGATLTTNEMASWKDAVALFQGMSKEQAKIRIDMLMADVRKDTETNFNSRYTGTGSEHNRNFLKSLATEGGFWDEESNRMVMTPKDLAASNAPTKVRTPEASADPYADMSDEELDAMIKQLSEG